MLGPGASVVALAVIGELSARADAGVGAARRGLRGEHGEQPNQMHPDSSPAPCSRGSPAGLPQLACRSRRTPVARYRFVTCRIWPATQKAATDGPISPDKVTVYL